MSNLPASLAVDLYRPPFGLPWVVMLLAGIVLIALVVYGYHQGEASWLRRLMLVMLRLTSLAAIAWILAGPSVQLHRKTVAQRPSLLVLADSSASMQEADVFLPGSTKPISRWAALTATWLSPDSLQSLGRAADVQLHRFDESLEPLSLAQMATFTAAGDETLLFNAVRQIAADPQRRGTVLLLLSDGHDTATMIDATAIKQLRSSGVSVWALPLGTASDIKDLAVQAWPDADFVFEDQSTTLHAAVLHRGLAGRRANIQLMRDGRLLESRQVDLTHEPVASVQFRVSPKPQPDQPITIVEYQIKVALADQVAAQPGSNEADGEVVLENNERSVFIQVSRQRMKVLLLEAEPYWDTRYLARVLDQDEHIDFTAIYKLNARRTISRQSGDQTDRAHDLSQAKLNSFDLIILGKRIEQFFPGDQANRLVDYVRQRGGALVLARGQAFSSDNRYGRQAQLIMDAISPVTWGREATSHLQWRLTAQGRQSELVGFDAIEQTDILLTKLPQMLAATKIESEKAASVVFVRQQGAEQNSPAMAAVAHQRAGRGQVFAVLSDGLWQWALLPGAQDRLHSVYHLFWSRAVRWLVGGGEFLPGQEVSLQLSRLTAQPGQTVEATIVTRYLEDENFAPRLRLIGPDGSVEQFTPQRDDAQSTHYRVTLSPQQSGVYRVELDSPDTPHLIDPTTPLTSRLAVYDRALERLDPSARPGVLKQLADATGGGCLGLDDQETLIEQLDVISKARQADARPVYDFARWPIFAMLVGGLGLEWILRRRGGLL